MLENLTFRTASKHCWSNREQFSPTCTTPQKQDFGPTALCAERSPSDIACEQTRSQSNAEDWLRLAAGCHFVYMHDAFQHLHMAHKLHHPCQTTLWRWLQSHLVFSLFYAEGLWVSVDFSKSQARLCSSPGGLHGLLLLTVSVAVWLSLESSKPCSSLGHFGTRVHILHLLYVAKDVNNLPHVFTQKQVTSGWNCKQRIRL